MMILPMEEIPDDGTEGLRRRRRSTTGSHYVLSLANVRIVLHYSNLIKACLIETTIYR